MMTRLRRALSALGLVLFGVPLAQAQLVTQFPVNGSVDVNPDTHLVLTFRYPPEAAVDEAGRAMSIRVSVAAVPDATYQWLDNGTPIPGVTGATLIMDELDPSDLSRFSVRVTNSAGSVISATAGRTR